MTTIHLIVPGTPVSCQSKRESLRRWKEKVAAVARAHVSRPQSGNDLAIAITYFFRVPPRCDTDNLSKPICDALSKIVYLDDRQIAERLARRVSLNGPFFLSGMPPQLALALCVGDEFVHIKILKAGTSRSLPLRTQLALAWC